MPAYEMVPSDKRHSGGGWFASTLRCGLSRPAAELQAIATLIERAYVFHAWVEDSVLYVSGSRDELGEALVRMHVEAARDVLAETLGKGPALIASPGSAPMRTVTASWDKPLRREYLAYSSKPFTVGYREFDHAMPKSWSGRSALVSGPEGGIVTVHFLHRDSYEKDHNDDLGSALFAILSGREITRGKHPDTLSLDPRGMTNEEVAVVGTVAMNLANDAIPAYEARLEALSVGGRSSSFTDDDNDARDIVLATLAAGGAIEVVGGSDRDDRRYVLDGIEVPLNVFDRLAEAGWLEGDGGYREPSRSYRISPREKVRPRDLLPREHSVSFVSFSEKCRYRRYDGPWECLNRNKHDQDDCSSHGCPLTSPVYHKEVGSFRDDPFFGWEDDRDVQVTADHPGTERSYAWRAAGARRVDDIVNIAIDAYARYRAGYACSQGEERAALEAIALGYLVRTEPEAKIVVVALTDELKARVEQAQSKAA